MEQSVAKLQSALMREYYKNFSKYMKGKQPAEKIAWVSSFAPVEILEAFEICYYYPESYAAVIAASAKEQKLLEKSENCYLSKDCCSYSCCIEGCLELEEGPRGVLPKPDILIVTNNQCNTLPNWWNILAERYKVPLIVLDYPGETGNEKYVFKYVTNQHKALIQELEKLMEKSMDANHLKKSIEQSMDSVRRWKELCPMMADGKIEPTVLFDAISFLVTSRCRKETAVLYKTLKEDAENAPEADISSFPMFWIGYPLWYHPKRIFTEYLDGFHICGSNYITWWNLDYSGEDVFEKLFRAYNYTFLNLRQETRNKILSDLIKKSGAVCTCTLLNRSCKCDFVSAKNIDIPGVELEMDMIDRTFLDEKRLQGKFEQLKGILA